jgi:hypothetical protein
MYLCFDSQLISTYLLSWSCGLRLPNLSLIKYITKYDPQRGHKGSHNFTKIKPKPYHTQTI